LIHGLAVGGQVLSQLGRDAEPATAGGARSDLWVVYLVWMGVVLALYPACRWFADLKRRRSERWLSYL
jgi:hypothetical protein